MSVQCLEIREHRVAIGEQDTAERDTQQIRSRPRGVAKGVRGSREVEGDVRLYRGIGTGCESGKTAAAIQNPFVRKFPFTEPSAEVDILSDNGIWL